MAKDIEVAERGEYGGKDYTDPPPAPLVDAEELTKWSLYRAAIAEFVATMLFLYVTVATVIGYKHQSDPDVNPADAACSGVGILGIAWAFGGMIFILVYCTAGVSGGHINPAVTLGLFLARKVSLVRALLYMVAQCLGAICGVGLVKGFQEAYFVRYGGGANELSAGYSKGTGLTAEIIGTFVLVYTVFAATDPKRNARDSHVPVRNSHCTPPYFSWCTWPRSRSPAPASTLRGAWELPSSTTRPRPGMTSGSSGWGLSSVLPLLPPITSTS
ncbi:hypothetical protein MUK42_18238 [Musa troglodytarum]|uniref:Uncharacterized protein n=1 Tax=Musa troglodytarum TaxID=320322 RepID=A0A9E7H4F2_9LILI|nr:hypothetical protein MUK42_18238 [Musa troglodytarum]